MHPAVSKLMKKIGKHFANLVMTSINEINTNPHSIEDGMCYFQDYMTNQNWTSRLIISDSLTRTYWVLTYFHSIQTNQDFLISRVKKLALVTPYVINLLDYIVKTKPKDICIFNGKAWDNLLFKRALIYNEIKDYNETKLIKKHKIKFFKYKNVKCVLFTKFLSSTGHEKMTDKKIRADTAKKIKCQYPTAKWRAR